MHQSLYIYILYIYKYILVLFKLSTIIIMKQQNIDRISQTIGNFTADYQDYLGDSRWSKRIVEWRPRTTKRSVGRPQLRWRDDIRKIAGGKLDVNSQKPTYMETDRRGLHREVDGDRLKKKKSADLCYFTDYLMKSLGNNTFYQQRVGM